MKYNFSGEVRSVLKQANLEAATLRHEYIGTEHILLAVLQQGAGPAMDVFAALDTDPDSLRAWILKKIKPGNRARSMEARPYTSRAKHVLEFTMATAREMGVATRGRRSATLETDHLLLGLLREEKGIAAQALRSFGATLDTVGETVQHLRGQDSHERPVSFQAPKRRTVRRSSEPAPPQDVVWYVQIDSDSSTPIYEQLIAQIEEAVATSLLVPGERLPPVRDLAAELGVAPGTVARAYSALEQRGVLATEGARGTRVADRQTRPSQKKDQVQPALADLLRPIAVAAYHMGARAQDVHVALESAMSDIFPNGQA